MDHVYRMGIAAGMQCKRSPIGGPARFAEFHYPQGCSNPGAQLDTPSTSTPTHAHFVQSSTDRELSGLPPVRPPTITLPALYSYFECSCFEANYEFWVHYEYPNYPVGRHRSEADAADAGAARLGGPGVGPVFVERRD